MASSSIQGFDSDVYLTETIPGLFRDAQAAASSVSSSVGPLYSETRMSTKRAILAWLSQSPTLKAWEGERQIKELTGNDYTIKADKYELTLGIDADDIDDLAERDAFAEQVMAGGEASAQHRDTLMWSFLRDDGETALCYDETPLFNASHPLKNGDTYSNIEAGSDTPWYLLDTTARAKGLLWGVRTDYTSRSIKADAEGNVSGFMTDRHLFGVKSRVVVAPGVPARIYKSKVPLTEASFESAWTKMSEVDGDEGRPLAILPTVLMVPNSLAFIARKLINSALVNGGNSNHLLSMVDVVVNPYL